MGQLLGISFDPDDQFKELQQDVIAAIGDEMDASDVSELIADLYEGADLTLRLLDALPARDKGYSVTTLMQRLREIVKKVEDGVEREQEKRAADANDYRTELAAAWGEA